MIPSPHSPQSNNGSRPRRSSLLALGAAVIIGLPVVMGQSPAPKAPAPPKAQAPAATAVKPTVPGADRHQPGKVFLEHADLLEMDEKRSPDFQILRGNVVFRKDNMFMYCDSAYFYEATNSLDAFSNVKMEQGDTLFVYGDELNYNGLDQIARLFADPGRRVRMINRDVTLSSDRFTYDIELNKGYYDTGGELTDKNNRLTSLEGEYYPATKDAFFFQNVVLTGPRRNDTLVMRTDSLRYNTDSRIATLLCYTEIENRDGKIISTSGTYNTATEKADLFARSRVITTQGNTLEGDTLFYDRRTGIGEAFGNMVINNPEKHSTLMGDYGFYNELTDSAFVTGSALAMEYSRPDTLFIHADTIVARTLPDSTHITDAFRNVRFFRRDIQGLCDSMVFTEADSTLLMRHHPVMWNGQRQIFGNEIMVHLTDSTADWARLPDFGMMVDHIADDCFDQLSGSDMTVWLTDTTVTRLYVEGNVQLILFPMEQDSTYNKFTFVESSFLDATFTDNNIDHVLFWPETEGFVTPLYLAKPKEYFLETFQNYSDLRPLAPDEVFDIPERMSLLMAQPPVGGRRRPAEGPRRGPAVPRMPERIIAPEAKPEADPATEAVPAKPRDPSRPDYPDLL